MVDSMELQVVGCDHTEKIFNGSTVNTLYFNVFYTLRNPSNNSKYLCVVLRGDNSSSRLTIIEKHIPMMQFNSRNGFKSWAEMLAHTTDLPIFHVSNLPSRLKVDQVILS